MTRIETTAAFTKLLGGDESTRLLLRSALLPDDAAWQAWLDWRARADLQTLRDPAISLMPLVYKRWESRLDRQDTVVPIMKGVYRRTWYKNQILLDQARGLAAALEQEGIPVVFLKGMAALLGFYGDPGLRVMKDLDVLVPGDCADRAAGILEARGFAFRDKFASRDFLRRYAHGCEFFSPRFGKIDLHWHAFHDLLNDAGDRLVWENRRSVDLKGLSVSIPGPACFVLHTLLGAARATGKGDYRWMTDIVFLLRSLPEETLDWSWLTRAVQTFPILGLPVRDTAASLEQEIPGTVPQAFLKAWSEPASASWYKRCYEWNLNPDAMGGAGFLSRWRWMWNFYRLILCKQMGRRPSILRTAAGFLSFLKVRLRMPTYAALFKAGWKELTGRPSKFWF